MRTPSNVFEANSVRLCGPMVYVVFLRSDHFRGTGIGNCS